MNFPIDFYEYLKTNTLIEIKGGINRKAFLNIWMIHVNERVFARSWYKSSKSWFTALINTGIGQIKYDKKVINIKGIKLAKDDEIHDLINRSYLNKYTQEENIRYAKGITQPEYADYTMEFLFENKN